jgi:hypothetical protein
MATRYRGISQTNPDVVKWRLWKLDNDHWLGLLNQLIDKPAEIVSAAASPDQHSPEPLPLQ